MSSSSVLMLLHTSASTKALRYRVPYLCTYLLTSRDVIKLPLNVAAAAMRTLNTILVGLPRTGVQPAAEP